MRTIDPAAPPDRPETVQSTPAERAWFRAQNPVAAHPLWRLFRSRMYAAHSDAVRCDVAEAGR
jgi:hypothetical protein